MFGIVDLLTFLLGTTLIVLLPGPNTLYIMAVSAHDGITAGFKGAAGIFCSDMVLMFLSVAGVASLIQTTPVLFNIIKCAGALYLVWLGVGLLKSVLRRDQDDIPAIDASTQKYQNPFRVAMMIGVLNPKAILFYVSFFIQFVDPNYDKPLLSFALLGVMVEIIAQAFFAALIISTVYFKGRLSQKNRLAKVVKAGAGSAFIGYGLKLAVVSI